MIFVKAPRLGAVKTRLAGDVGAAAALRFYRDTAGGLIRRLGRDPRWRCWLAVTPDRFARNGRFRRRGPPCLPQGAGDLGARMARAMLRLPPGPVVIVGADVPELSAGHVERAFRALGRRDAVLGPSPDGGYWLVGLRRRARARAMFRDVRWSTRHALADTLRGLGSDLTVELLDELADIDDGAGLALWRRMRRNSRCT